MRNALTRWWPAVLGAAVIVAAVGVRAVVASNGPEPRVIELQAKRFEFNPPELRLAAGQPVTLRITSADVTHGLFQKELGIDGEISPGRATEVKFTPAKAGRYTVICDHFCGPGHGNMHLVLFVE
jgi:cytochrome c oxidase subunit II